VIVGRFIGNVATLQLREGRAGNPLNQAQMGQQPLPHIGNTGVHARSRRNLIIPLISRDDDPTVITQDMGTRQLVRPRCGPSDRGRLHVQRRKESLFKKLGIRHPCCLHQDITKKTEHNILVAVASPWVTHKGDLLQPIEDVVITHNILNQVSVSMRHQPRGLIGEMK